jgi:DNA adenine methylase
MITKPVLRWPGGKGRHLKKLLPLIPEHTCYVEPFAGGLALLLAKERSGVEVVNDINRDLVALYRCAQFHIDALCEELKWVISSRVGIQEYKQNRGLTDLQRAARFLIANRTSFGGTLRGYAVQRTKGGGASVCKAYVIESLHRLHDRLDKVLIENLDWTHCLKLYDSADTFFFIDPPYLNANINIYDGWTEAKLTDLRNALRTLKGKWVLTVDGSDFCRKLFREWDCYLFDMSNKCVNSNVRLGARFKEMIVTPAGLPGPHRVSSEGVGLAG